MGRAQPAWKPWQGPPRVNLRQRFDFLHFEDLIISVMYPNERHFVLKVTPKPDTRPRELQRPFGGMEVLHKPGAVDLGVSGITGGPVDTPRPLESAGSGSNANDQSNAL